MPGLNLYAAARGGAGVGAAGAPADAAVAAFSPNATVSVTSQPNPLHPNQPFGLAVWIGAGAMLLLVVIRHSLPR